MKKTINRAKIVWIVFWASFMTVIVFFPICLSALASKTGNLPFTISKIWARVMLFVSFTRVSVTGKELIAKNSSYIIISNHQSLYDIIALVTTLGIQFRWIIKEEIKRIPLFGYALLKSRNIFIDRSNPQRARDSMAEGMARLPDGVSVLVFAEGTRSNDGKLKEFKKGGFVIALENHFPILPVTVNGSRKVMPRSSLVFHPGRIEVIVSRPIDTATRSGPDLDSIIQLTRNAIEANLIPD